MAQNYTPEEQAAAVSFPPLLLSWKEAADVTVGSCKSILLDAPVHN